MHYLKVEEVFLIASLISLAIAWILLFWLICRDMKIHVRRSSWTEGYNAGRAEALEVFIRALKGEPKVEEAQQPEKTSKEQEPFEPINGC